MLSQEEYLKSIIDGLSVGDLCKVGSTLIQEDLVGEIYGNTLDVTEEEFYSEDGQMVTLGISQPEGPDPRNRFLNYYTGIAAQFLIKSFYHEKEIDALVEYFYKMASRSIENKQIRTGWNGISYYLITNLELEPIKKQKKYIKRKLTQARDKLGDKYSINVGNFGIFAEENIIEAAIDYKNLKDSMMNIRNQYGRLVFNLDENNELHVENALLSGMNCVSLGESNIVSKISLPQKSSPKSIKHLEELINSTETKERDLQEFFENNPKLLSMGEYVNIYPQCVLTRDDDSDLRPDFILEPASGQLSTILDIKLPSEKIVIKKKNRPRFSAKVYEYISQMREYGKFFDSYENRSRFEKRYGIKGFRPRMILVVGRDYSPVDYQILNQLRSDLKDVEIITYDELTSKCKELAKITLP